MSVVEEFVGVVIRQQGCFFSWIFVATSRNLWIFSWIFVVLSRNLWTFFFDFFSSF